MSARNLVFKTAECCGVLVLVVAALPLIAIAGWLARGLAIIVAFASLIGLLLLTWVNPGFRERVGRVLGLTAAPHAGVGPAVRRRP
jgi:hypothetical protein